MASQVPGDVASSPKQIVFLFIAATVVAVVVFLFGVLVGRGVPFVQPLLRMDSSGAAAASLFGDDRRPAVVSTRNAEPSAAALSGDDLTYVWRLGLESDALPEDALRKPRVAAEPPLPVEDLPEPTTGEVVALRPAPSSPTRPPEVEQASGVGVDPSLTRSQAVADSTAAATARPGGWAVQVMALRELPAAHQVAHDLSAKGYRAFVVDPVPDAPVDVFRVRVGPFSNRADAERAQQRLETEEQFKPWITR